MARFSIFTTAFLKSCLIPYIEKLNLNYSHLNRFLPFPRFPLPGDEYSYIVCVENQPRIQACGDYSVFDPQLLTCVYIEEGPGLPPPGAFGPPPF